jgi:hypothetical protein
MSVFTMLGTHISPQILHHHSHTCHPCLPVLLCHVQSPETTTTRVNESHRLPCEGNPVGFATLRNIDPILRHLRMQIRPRMALERTVTHTIPLFLVRRPLLPFLSSHSCVQTVRFTSVRTSVLCGAGPLDARLFLVLMHQLLR